MIADLLEKIGERTKGEIANQCKRRVLKSSGGRKTPSMKWGMRICPLPIGPFPLSVPTAEVECSISEHKGRGSPRPSFRIIRTET